MDDEVRVGGHLRTLSICHYIYSALSACLSAFGLIYIALGQIAGQAIEHSAKQKEGQAPPPEVAKMFTWFFTTFGIAMMVGALTVAVLCFLSARGLSRRTNRTLSLVVAGVLCMTGLLGIALGVFTFIVLLKPETERLYGAAPPA